MKWRFFILHFVSFFLFSIALFSDSNGFSKARVFSLTSEEMVFASKLSDANRRRFCYQFSLKERHLAMQFVDGSLSADARVEEVFSSFHSRLEAKADTR